MTYPYAKIIWFPSKTCGLQKPSYCVKARDIVQPGVAQDSTRTFQIFT